MSGAGGKCEHRVGCFFHLDMETWSDALLALSVMQAAANDVFQRWKCMPLRQRIAADATLAGLPTLREASAPESNSALDESEAEHDDRHAILDSDTAALKTAGVAKATPLYPPPIVIYQEGTTPPEVVRGYTGLCAPGHKPSCVRLPFVVQRMCRVYRGTWKHNGVARDVIVKVVSRRQAAREARVLEAVSVRKEARAIQLLAQVPINGSDGDVGLVTHPSALAVTCSKERHRSPTWCDRRCSYARCANSLPVVQFCCSVAHAGATVLLLLLLLLLLLVVVVVTRL